MSEDRQPSSIDSIKRRAKAIKAQSGVQHKDALEAAARQAGFSNYTNARTTLARPGRPLPAIPPAPRPPGMTEAGGREPFLEGCRRAWVQTLDVVDPEGRELAAWDDPAEITRVLQAVITRTRSHAHLPTGGGQDFTDVRASHERGVLEFQIEKGLVYLAKPGRLLLQRVPSAPAESFLLLELGKLDASGAYPPDDRPLSDRDWMSRREEVVELGPRDYVERSVWDQGFLDYDADGGEIPLPNASRLVVRWFDGKILFVTKGSMWNGTPSTYDGRHDKMSPAQIRAMIKRSIPGRQVER